MAFYYMAAIKAEEKQYSEALEFVRKALVKNSHNVKARGLKTYLLRKLGLIEKAAVQAEENLKLDSFDFISANEEIILKQNPQGKEKILERKMRGFEQNYLMCARDYAEMGAYEEAIGILLKCRKEHPMVRYYLVL